MRAAAGSRRDKSAFDEALSRQQSAGLLRVETQTEKKRARSIFAGGREFVDFSSNSYLGLQDRVRSAAIKEFVSGRHPTSASSSRMVSGTRGIHRKLETDISRHLKTEDAVVFGSGFLCCAGVIATLAGSRDLIAYDDRIHASLRVGISLSKAESLSYPHGRVDELARLIRSRRVRGHVFFITDGLFSMDGDFAPLDRLVDLAARAGAWIVIDDAHGIGAIGKTGRGIFEKFGLRPREKHILIGTLSKTLASFGGFAAGSSSVIRYIKARSKEYIYTTAAPPFQVIAARAALRVARSREGVKLRRRLESNMDMLSRELGVAVQSPIVSIPVPGGSAAVLDASRRLRAAGCYAMGMRYPTVPRGREMIRISLSAAHTKGDILKLSRAIRSLSLAR